MSEAWLAGYYSVVRYVANPIRDEAVNIGLIMVSEDGQRACAWRHSPETVIRAHEPEFDTAFLRVILTDFDGMVAGDFGHKDLEYMARNWCNCVQVTEPRCSLLKDSAEFKARFDQLFATFVARRASEGAK